MAERFEPDSCQIDRSAGQVQIDGMTRNTLREMRDAAPFKPFEIYLTDGRALKVITPDHLFFLPNGGEFLVVPSDGGFRFVDYNQVVSVGRSSGRPRVRKDE